MEQALLGYFYSSVAIAPFFIAFIAGALSFLSPCTLPLIPFYMSYISGISLAELTALNPNQNPQNLQTTNPKNPKNLTHDSLHSPHKKNAKTTTKTTDKTHHTNATNPKDSSKTLSTIRYQIFIRSFAFVLGFSFVFIMLGSALRSVFFVLDSRILEMVAGAIVIMFGVHFLGILRFRFLYATKKFNLNLDSTKDFPLKSFIAPAIKILAPFLLGVSFGLGWSPCTGPIFGSIALMASTSVVGFALLCLYALGFALPFLLIALMLERGFELADRLKPHLAKVEIFSGILLIIIGIFIISGDLGKITQYFSPLSI